MSSISLIDKIKKIATSAGSYILSAYLLILAVVYPFYMKTGYVKLGVAKYEFFILASIICLAVMGVLILLTAILSVNSFSIENIYINLSLTDKFAYFFFLALLLSFLLGKYQNLSLKGEPGWQMGLYTYLIILVFYSVSSVYITSDVPFLVCFSFGSFLVLLLAILNRYSVYPFEIEGQAENYLSTMGNVNWLCGYLSVIFPIAFLSFLLCKKLSVRIVCAIYIILFGTCALTQGSNGIYISIAAVLLFCFFIGLYSSERFYRFLLIPALICFGFQTARLLNHIPALKLNYKSDYYAVLMDSNLSLFIGLLFVIIYALVRFIFYKYKIRLELHTKYTTRIIILSLIIILISSAFPIRSMVVREQSIRNTQVSGTESDREETKNLRLPTNGRVVIWQLTFHAFDKMSVSEKIFGVGPDSYASFLYDTPSLEEEIIACVGNSRLTNAHCEPLTILINYGITGLVSFYGFLISFVVRCLKASKSKPSLYIFAACVISYFAFNLTSFAQVLNIPYLFVIIGLGEGQLRLVK